MSAILVAEPVFRRNEGSGVKHEDSGVWSGTVVVHDLRTGSKRRYL